MNEFGIIKLELNLIQNGTYDRIIEIFKYYCIEILKTRSYTKTVTARKPYKDDTNYHFLTLLVKGKNVKNILPYIKSEYNNPGLNYDRQIYVSSEDFFEFDLFKYFNMSMEDLTNLGSKYDKKELEQTLAIIKPDAFKHREKIKKILYENGLKIVSERNTFLKRDDLKAHYSHLIDMPFYNNVENYMLSGPVDIMVLEGVDAVEKLRNLMGPTDSKTANPYTIRGMYGTDITHNAIHGSDSLESAEQEIERFFNQRKKVLK